ncbi:MAG: phage tail protein [Frankiales bacterium]|nr:phage tail protein [Frankiales bacterium]
MSEPFIGEIKLTSFNFPPSGWALCNGQLLPIQQNQAMFSVIGTMYGGDGISTFGLPDLRGRIPLHFSAGLSVGNSGGEESHVLQVTEIPVHNHPARAQSVATNPGGDPTNSVWAAGIQPMFAPTPTVTMNPAALSNAGSGQAHENRAPYLTLNFIIALVGIFPSRN